MKRSLYWSEQSRAPWLWKLNRCLHHSQLLVAEHDPQSSTDGNHVPQVALDTPTMLPFDDPARDTSQKLH